MSDAAWGFWGSILGSLIGGGIAYAIAIKAALLQTQATWTIQRDKLNKELAWQLLQYIDDYLFLSFKTDKKEERQRVERSLLTTASLCMPERVNDIRREIKNVELYHYAKQEGRTLPRGVAFTPVRQYFEQLQSDICKKHLGFAWEDTAPDDIPPTA